MTTTSLRAVRERFLEQGYLVVPGMFAGAELAALQEETAAQIAAGPGRGPDSHFKRGTSAEGREVLFRIEAVVAKALCNDSTLLALAHPRLLATVAELLGRDHVCWSDALLWKGPDGGAAVPMHSAHGWNDPAVGYENLVVDVYLDEATPANGCLKVLPGSHRLPPEQNRALVEQGYDVPGLVDVVLRPGDVLFHSEWMVHGSAATPYLGVATRRILYFAFRHPGALVAQNPSPALRRVLAACVRRMQLAQEARRAAPYAAGETPHPVVVPDGWEQDVAAVRDDEAMRIGCFEDVLVT